MGTFLLGYFLFSICAGGTFVILMEDDAPIKLDEHGNEVE